MWNIIVTVFQIEFRKHLNTNVHVSSWIVFYIPSRMFLTCSHTQQMSPKLHSKEMLTCHKIQKQKSLTSHMTCEGCDDNRSQKSQNVCLVDLRFWQSLQITNSGFLRVSQGLSGSLRVSQGLSQGLSRYRKVRTNLKNTNSNVWLYKNAHRIERFDIAFVCLFSKPQHNNDLQQCKWIWFFMRTETCDKVAQMQKNSLF